MHVEEITIIKNFNSNPRLVQDKSYILFALRIVFEDRGVFVLLFQLILCQETENSMTCESLSIQVIFRNPSQL